MVIPRIGMEVEVVVELLDGDPDKPLVTGCVYNGKNDVPYDLPANKTRSTFRTDTHQGRGFNELRFEDKNDEEEIYLHAERDRNEKTRNNHTERIDNNWVQSVGHNKASEVDNNLTEVIGGDVLLRIGPSQRHAIAPDMPSSNTAGISGLGEAFGKKGKSPKGSGNLTISVEQDKSQTIMRDHSEVVKHDKVTEVGHDYSAVVDRNILLDAGKTITLKCGASSVVLHANGTIALGGQTCTVGMDKLVQLGADMVKIN